MPQSMLSTIAKRSFLLNGGGIMRPSIAVVGGGYWGKNLVRNFFELGTLCAVCDPSPDVEAEVHAKYPQVEFHRDFAQVLSTDHIRGIVLATPAKTHFEMAK